jgi:hypothetical protein
MAFDIATRGKHQDGGRIWFGGKVFEDGTIEQFDEDCQFPCQDLSQSSLPSDCHRVLWKSASRCPKFPMTSNSA